MKSKEHKEYFENGQLWKHCFYLNGKLHGEYKAYYQNGQLWEHCFYLNGNRLGFFGSKGASIFFPLR